MQLGMHLRNGVFLIFRTSKFFDATYRTEYVSVAWTYFTAAEIVYHERCSKFLNRRI